ncbi:MAG: hypothetical protein ACK5HR_04530 [Mycoplasmatales bacterium]
MRVNKENIKDSENSIYQLVVPITMSNELKINYEEILKKNNFKKENLANDVNDLLYLNVVEETYKQGFDTYINKCEETEFLIISNIKGKRECYLELNILEIKFIFDNNSLEYSDKKKFFITILLEDTKKQQDIPKEQIITILSEFHNPEINTYGSMIKSKNKETYFLHGNFSYNSIANRFYNLLNFFEEEKFLKYKNLNNNSDRKDKLIKLSNNINFPFGKNIFILYYEKNEIYFNRVKKAIKEEWNNFEEKSTSLTLISNIYETKHYYNIELKNYKKIIEKCFYKKWINNDTIYVTTPNTFGVILKDNFQKAHILDPSIIFTKYALAIFFSLNQRILILDLQESIKGVKESTYENLNKYYKYTEKYVFYEVSPEIQLQQLYEMLQEHLKNNKLMAIINSEIEISQNRRLNNEFKKLTSYSLYISILALILAIPSYSATFYSIANDYGNIYVKISKVLSNPIVVIGIVVIVISISIIYLNKKD